MLNLRHDNTAANKTGYEVYPDPWRSPYHLVNFELPDFAGTPADQVRFPTP